MFSKPISVIFVSVVIVHLLLLPALIATTKDQQPFELHSQISPEVPVSLWQLTSTSKALVRDQTTVLGTSDKLSDLLQRRGPNIRASSDYHDFKDIYLDESIEAWKLMRKRAELFAKEQVYFYKPKIMSLLKMANVSEICETAVNLTFDAIENLNSWSIKMWSASGNFPPVGMFDGQLTDMGSYYGCLDAVDPRQNLSSVAYTNYCMLAFRPVIPSRPKNHMVFNKLPNELLHLFNESDAFYDIAQEAQYFYYFYLRMGLCVPYQCSPEDVQRAAILIGSQNFFMMNGPVKCYTRAPRSKQVAAIQALQQAASDSTIEFGKIENEPILVELSSPLNRFQRISLLSVGIFFLIVFLSSIWHAMELLVNYFLCDTKVIEASFEQDAETKETLEFINKNPPGRPIGDKLLLRMQQTNGEQKHEAVIKLISQRESDEFALKHIAFEYFSVITNARDALDCKSVKSPSEIKCLHGIRVLTMVWVISVHVLQYNQWDGFTRIYENVKVLQNLALHPVYNASYVVDNFFLMSGLLASYTILLSKRKGRSNFNFAISLIRQGPFWYDMTHYTAKYCEKNWWVNLLHLQSFYKKDEICNLVGWWISVDMFYYVIALLFITMIMRSNRAQALLWTLILIVSFHAYTAYKHFIAGYTPNNLGTVPQVDDNWTGFVVDFFWSPFAHVVPFYLGFWCGYILAYDYFKAEVRRYQRWGWTLSTITLIIVNFSSHIWMAGYWALDNQLISTLYNGLCPIAWALSFAWIVVALHYDCGPKWCNKLLSTKLFVIISKASFIVYLSHMLLLRYYFGIQISLIEVSKLNLIFVVASCIFLSIIVGVFLNITFEGPCLKFQRFAINKFKSICMPSKSSTIVKQTKKDGEIVSSNNTDGETLNLEELGRKLLKS